MKSFIKKKKQKRKHSEEASEAALDTTFDEIFRVSFDQYLNKGFTHNNKTFRGRDKVVQEYNRTTDENRKKELRREVIEIDLAFSEKITGLSWEAYLNETKETNNFIEDFIEGNIEYWRNPKPSASSPLFPLTTKITTYLFQTSKVWDKINGKFKKEKGIWKNFKDNLIKDETITNKDGKKQYISSQVTSLSNDIISQSDDITYSDRFQTVANSSKDANIENSQISIDAENIVDKPNKKFWNNNELVKYFRDVKNLQLKFFLLMELKIS